jgi:hypothetical protein
VVVGAIVVVVVGDGVLAIVGVVLIGGLKQATMAKFKFDGVL